MTAFVPAVRVFLTYYVYAPLRMLGFLDFRRLLCVLLSLGTKYIPLLVLVFLGSCRLLFGKGRIQFVYALYSINRVRYTHIRAHYARARCRTSCNKSIKTGRQRQIV